MAIGLDGGAHKDDSGNLIDIYYDSNIPLWQDNSIFVLGSSFKEKEIPVNASLLDAYPNPFNPITTMNFAIPNDSHVSIKVYNLQGREVVSLADGNYDAGYHNVMWDANSYSSGVYFVKMIAGEFIATQKLMLVK